MTDRPPAEETVRISTVLIEHERRLNATENHLDRIDQNVEGLRGDFNEHANDMIGKISTLSTAVKVAGVIGTIVLAAIIGLLVRLIENH